MIVRAGEGECHRTFAERLAELLLGLQQGKQGVPVAHGNVGVAGAVADFEQPALVVVGEDLVRSIGLLHREEGMVGGIGVPGHLAVELHHGEQMFVGGVIGVRGLPPDRVGNGGDPAAGVVGYLQRLARRMRQAGIIRMSPSRFPALTS